MASYETEHDIKPTSNPEPRRQRPDMSTFLSSFDHVNTEQTQNPNAEPTPGDLAAVFRNAAEWYSALRRDVGDAGVGAGPNDDASNDLLSGMIEQLWGAHEHPSTKKKGVSEVFIADLDRVPKKNLKADDSCPICRMPFLDDEYPLVVRLPCHKDHVFDLECLQPWLKMNNSCPLDRKELEKKREPPPAKDDDEEEYDDMYA